MWKYVLAWFLGVPIFVLVVIYLLFTEAHAAVTVIPARVVVVPRPPIIVPRPVTKPRPSSASASSKKECAKTTHQECKK